MIKNKTLILGVGNVLRRDDGVGPAIIKLLQSENIVGTDLLDGGIDGLALLDIIQEHARVILIDAVTMNLTPGSVKLFSPNEAKLKIKSDALSTHGFGLAEVIHMMEALEIKTDLQIIGIQPQDVSFGEGLTDVVQSKLPSIVNLVKQTL